MTDTADRGGLTAADIEARWRELAATFLNESRAQLGLSPLATIPATGLIPDVVDGQLIEAAWGNAVRNIGVARMDSFAALQAGWPAAPNGSRAVTLDTFRTYTKRGAGAAGWMPDSASGLVAVTFSAGAGTIAHDLGRAPTTALVVPGQNLGGSTVSVTALATLGVTTTTIQVGCWVATSGAAFAGSRNVWWFVA